MPHLHYRSIVKIGLSAALLFSLGACAGTKKEPRFGGAADGSASGQDGDFVKGTPLTGTPLPERREGVSFMGENVDKGRFAPVYFGFDSYVVEPSEAAKLNQVAEFFRNEPGKQLVIAGFTDERGTAEYNRGLGEKRAQAVRSFLLDKGADSSRIQTTSFGSEMPADPGSNESAWAKNRRAEFGVTK